MPPETPASAFPLPASLMLISGNMPSTAALESQLLNGGLGLDVQIEAGGNCNDLVHQVAARAPDQVIIFADAPAVGAALRSWAGTPPCAISWLASPPPARDLDGLVAAGLTGWWPVHGCSLDALAVGLALDRARWMRERSRVAELDDVRARLDERKWLDRAKGVLAQARGLGEAEAFQLLRGAAMHSNQKLSAVSRSVTEAAAWAEALNRAGQLRMLSQRLVKLAAQRLIDVDAYRARRLEEASLAKAQAILEALAQLPKSVAVDESAQHALAQTRGAWELLASSLVPRMTLPALAQADAHGLALLAAAEALTSALEKAAGRRPLTAVNLCGRQRMLAQRIAKDALLADLIDQAAHREALASSIEAFESALQQLEKTPLSTGDIRDSLADARDEWLRLIVGMRATDSVEGKLMLTRTSELLLDAFDRLTTLYEHNLQVLMS